MLLHGFPQTHLAWRDVAVELAEDRLVVCLDLRGYGAGDKPPAAFRAAMDHPEAVSHLAVLDVIPPGGHLLPEQCREGMATIVRELYSAGRS